MKTKFEYTSGDTFQIPKNYQSLTRTLLGIGSKVELKLPTMNHPLLSFYRRALRQDEGRLKRFERIARSSLRPDLGSQIQHLKDMIEGWKHLMRLAQEAIDLRNDQKKT